MFQPDIARSCQDDAHEWGVRLAEFPKLDQMLVSAGVYGAELSHFEGARLIVA